MADDYPFGAANKVPHIHRYKKGDCHLKVQSGRSIDRYDLVQGGRRVKQSNLNEAFDAVRAAFPLATDTTRVNLLATMKDMVRNVSPHPDDMPKT